MTDFVHLHLHSEYSLLDGACRIEELLDRAVQRVQDLSHDLEAAEGRHQVGPRVLRAHVAHWLVYCEELSNCADVIERVLPDDALSTAGMVSVDMDVEGRLLRFSGKSPADHPAARR